MSEWIANRWHGMNPAAQSLLAVLGYLFSFIVLYLMVLVIALAPIWLTDGRAPRWE